MSKRNVTVTIKQNWLCPNDITITTPFILIALLQNNKLSPILIICDLIYIYNINTSF